MVDSDDIFICNSIHMELERSFYYHDALAAIGVPDDFNELGMIEKNTTITARAA
jgi:hypothetical protein